MPRPPPHHDLRHGKRHITGTQEQAQRGDQDNLESETTNNGSQE